VGSRKQSVSRVLLRIRFVARLVAHMSCVYESVSDLEERMSPQMNCGMGGMCPAAQEENEEFEFPGTVIWFPWEQDSTPTSPLATTLVVLLGLLSEYELEN